MKYREIRIKRYPLERNQNTKDITDTKVSELWEIVFSWYENLFNYVVSKISLMVWIIILTVVLHQSCMKKWLEIIIFHNFHDYTLELSSIFTFAYFANWKVLNFRHEILNFVHAKIVDFAVILTSYIIQLYDKICNQCKILRFNTRRDVLVMPHWCDQISR